MFSLFQIMTLESWSMGIVRPVMGVFPYAWVFFVPFIVVIVNSMQTLNAETSVGLHQEAKLAHGDREELSQ